MQFNKIKNELSETRTHSFGPASTARHFLQRSKMGIELARNAGNLQVRLDLRGTLFSRNVLILAKTTKMKKSIKVTKQKYLKILMKK